MNSSLVFNTQMKEIADKTWILAKSREGKDKSNV